MSQFNTLKSAIRDVIKQNGNNEITGDLLQQSLIAIIDSIGSGFQYLGIATPETQLGNPDQRVFYIAVEGGNYGGSLTVAPGINVLKYETEWSVEPVVLFDDAPTDGSQNLVQSGNLAKIYGSTQTNPEYIKVLSDKSGKIIYGVKNNGEIDFFVPVNIKEINSENFDVEELVFEKLVSNSATLTTVENAEFILANIDKTGKTIFGINKDGDIIVFTKIVIPFLSADTINCNVVNMADKAKYISTENAEFVFVKTDNENKIIYGVKNNGDLFFGAGVPEQILAYINEKLFAEMYVAKTATTMDVYLRHAANYYIHYIFSRRQKEYIAGTDSFFDNWGIDRVALSEYNGLTFTHVKYLYREGETEQAFELINNGTAKWVGGAFHGYEQVNEIDNKRLIYVLVDGTYFEESDVISLRPCSYVDMFQQTSIYEYDTTTNPFGIVFKEWLFENAHLTLTTDTNFLRDIRIRTIAGSMMCVYRHDQGNANNPYLTDMAIKDIEPFVTYDLTDGHTAIEGGANCRKITEFGELGFSFAIQIVDDSKMHNTGGLVIIEAVSTYNKMYGYTLRAGGTGIDIAQGSNYGLKTKHLLK